jgi:hypothetical protein
VKPIEILYTTTRVNEDTKKIKKEYIAVDPNKRALAALLNGRDIEVKID